MPTKIQVSVIQRIPEMVFLLSRFDRPWEIIKLFVRIQKIKAQLIGRLNLNDPLLLSKFVDVRASIGDPRIFVLSRLRCFTWLLVTFPFLCQGGQREFSAPSCDLLTSKVIELREIYFSALHPVCLQILRRNLAVD